MVWVHPVTQGDNEEGNKQTRRLEGGTKQTLTGIKTIYIRNRSCQADFPNSPLALR